MCMSSKSPAPAQTPAAAPPPPVVDPIAPVIDKDSSGEDDLLKSRRNGRRSLRIDIGSESVSGGTGANLPVA